VHQAGLPGHRGGQAAGTTAVVQHPGAGRQGGHDQFVGAQYGNDAKRIVREQTLPSSLVTRAQSQLLNPAAIYRFAEALASSLTVDSQFGGVTGLYNLERTLHGIPSGQITQFTLPNYPRSQVVPADTADVLWTQPQDSQIFAAIRADQPVSSSLRH
jgi:hypothetical protein